MSSNVESEVGKDCAVDEHFDVIFRFSSRSFCLLCLSSSVRIKSFLIPTAKHRSNRHRGHFRRSPDAVEH